MQKNTLLLLICFWMSFIYDSFAQKQVSIYIGGTISNITNIDRLRDFRVVASIDASNHFRAYPSEGMLFGFCFKRQLNEKVNLNTKFGYVGMGQRAIELSGIPDFKEAWWINKQQKKNYISLAPSIIYKTNYKINFILGIQAQYLYKVGNYFDFRQRTYSTITGLSFQEFNIIYGNNDYADQNYDYHTKIDFGLNVGFTYRLSNSFSIDFSAYKGLRSIDILSMLPDPNTPYIRRNVSYSAALVVDIPRWKKEITNSKK
jgi:hypothetical protein